MTEEIKAQILEWDSYLPQVKRQSIDILVMNIINLAVSKERERLQDNIDHVLQTLDNMNSAGDFKHYKTYSDLHDAVSLINTK